MAVQAVGLMPKGKTAKIALELGFCAVALQLGLVSSISIFEQEVAVEPHTLEQRFHELKHQEDGSSVDSLHYNKGL